MPNLITQDYEIWSFFFAGAFGNFGNWVGDKKRLRYIIIRLSVNSILSRINI